MDLENVLIVATLAFSLLISLVSLAYSVSMFRRYRNLPSSRIAIIQLLLVLWLAMNVYTNMTYQVSQPLSEASLVFLSKLGLAFLFLAFIILSYMQINSLYNRKTRLFGSISMGGFNFCMAYIFSDLLGQTDYFEVSPTTSNFTLSFSSFIGWILVFSGLCYFISFYFALQRIRELPAYLYSSNSSKVIQVVGSIVFVLGLTLLFFFIKLHGEIVPTLGLALVLFLSVLALLYVYFNYTQPFIQVGNGANPIKLLEYKFIGFYVGTALDSGPSIHLVDRQFLQRSGLTQIQIQTAIVGVMTMVGINDSFADRISLVPIPQSTDFISVNLTFQVSNQQVKDPRYKDHAPSVLGIILPALMSPSLRNLTNLQLFISQQLGSTMDINELTEPVVVQLISRILHEILH